MKKTLFLSIFLCFFGLAQSQTNLVDNYSFENEIPGTPGSMPSGSSANQQKIWDHLPPWQVPDSGTGNFCFTDNVGSPDLHHVGGHTGNNYIFCAYQEYVCAPLITPMEPGKAYYIEYYVKNTSTALTDAGLLLVESKPNQCGADRPISNDGTPQVPIPYGTDVTSWTKVSGTFVADKSYQWLVLGNFNTCHNCSGREYNFDDITIICIGDGLCPNYNYIQNTTFRNVGVIKFDSQYLTTAGNNVTSTKSTGNVIVGSDANVEFKSATLVNLAPGFSVEQGGIFSAKIAPCGSECFLPTANAGTDATSCSGQTLQLGGSAAFGFSYSWSATPASAINYLSNSNISNPMFTPPGNGYGTITYKLTVNNECGQSASDDIIIKYNSNSNGSPSVSVSNINYTDLINFDVSCGPTTEVVKIEILTTNGSVVNTYNYYTTLDFSCCSFHWEIPNRLSPCQDYQIRVSSKNICSSTYSTPVLINWTRNRTLSFTSLPNVFTPNGDGVNDVWGFGFTGGISYNMNVYDQWGTNRFTGASNIFPPSAYVWNGSGLPDNTYYYTLEITGCDGGKINTSGNILITGTNRATLTDELQNMQEQTPKTVSDIITKLLIMPNPTNNTITIDVPDIGPNTTMSIINFAGQTIYSGIITDSKTVVDLSAYDPGMYLVNIISNGTSKSAKVIKN